MTTALYWLGLAVCLSALASAVWTFRRDPRRGVGRIAWCLAILAFYGAIRP